METGALAPQAGLPATGPPRRSRRRWGVLALGAVCAAIVVIEGLRAMTPPAALLAAPRTVEIPAGAGVLQVARLLGDEEIIRSRPTFVLLATLRGSARSLKAGEYEFPRGASLLLALQLIEQGRVKPHLVVLPEGATVRELARRLEAEGIASTAEVLRVADSPAFLRGLGIEAASVEGYLYPDSYQVAKGLRVEEILSRMVLRFREKVATPEILARARARNLDLHGLVTLASIIEREAALAEERPLISAVFWNRLRLDMPLQADPTAAYAAGKDDRPPSKRDLEADHPYNTYRRRGLPPGPIGNPGLPAIEAALLPAEVPYLYFVAIDDRHHHFSVTLEEHNRAVLRYRRSRARASAL